MKKKNKIIAVVLFVLFLMSIIVFDVLNIPSRIIGMKREMLELNSWVNLVISSIVAVFAAFIAAYATIKSVSMTIKKQEDDRKEDNRKDVLPMIRIDCLSKQKMTSRKEVCVKQKIDKPLKKLKSFQCNGYIKIPIKNVGLREMYDVHVLFEDSEDFVGSEEEQFLVPILYKDDLVYMLISIITFMPKSIDESETEFVDDYHNTVKLFFSILFTDCFGNKYKQKFSIDIAYDYLRIVSGRDKGLYRDYENASWVDFETLSAPVLIKSK